MIIKEEGLEALADQASSDSGQYRDDPSQDDGDDPDYQVDLSHTSTLKSLFLFLPDYVPNYYIKN